MLPPARIVELPCCYGGELGFELEGAAAKLGLAADEVVRLHAGAVYYVDFVGFTPGLPYLSGMPERLFIPRFETPRVKTPPGSVSIGGHAVLHLLRGESGRVLGARPHAGPALRSGRADPILLRAGDRVRFRAIDRAEFDAIAAAVAAGEYEPRIHQGVIPNALSLASRAHRRSDLGRSPIREPR